MATANPVIPKLLALDGCVGCCLVEAATGTLLGAAGGDGFDLAAAAARCTEAVRVQRRTLGALELPDRLEDILFTLGRQYHLIRPLARDDARLLYVVLDKAKANLALARHQLTAIERELTATASP